MLTPRSFFFFLNFITQGRKHEGLLNDLQRFAFSTTCQPMCLYGDPVYQLCIHLQAPFRNTVLTPATQAFNSLQIDQESSCYILDIKWVECMTTSVILFPHFTPLFKLQYLPTQCRYLQMADSIFVLPWNSMQYT